MSLIDRYDSLFEPRMPRSVCNNGQSATSSSSGSGSTSATTTIPQNIQQLLNQSAGYATSAGQMGALGLPGQFGSNPEQIAGLTPQQQSMIWQLQNQGTSSPDIAAARGELSGANNQLSELTSGPIGSSPATIAAMQSYNTNAVPQAMQAQSLSGSGRGGSTADALTSSREAAYTPLVQQEIGNRENAVNQYNSLAGTSAGLAGDVSNLKQTALDAAGMQQQTQQAQNDAAYQDMLRRFGLDQSTALGPIQQVLDQLLGRNVNQTSNQTGSSSSTPGTLDSILGGIDVAGSLFGDAASFKP